MTTTQHTLGPWLITNGHIENGEWVIGIASEKQDGTLALVIGSKARPGYTQESIEATSNACLIAAAPELLEALEGMFEDFITIHEMQNKPDYIAKAVAERKEKARAAIAKARGQC